VQFTRRLREGVRRGEITCSIRIWMRPHVKVGNRYPIEGGAIEVDAIVPIAFDDITPELARASGFLGVVDLLKTAKHGPGENVYLVRFHFIPAATAAPPAARRKPPAATRRSSGPPPRTGRAGERERARPIPSPRPRRRPH
jgi:hypothetical protein